MALGGSLPWRHGIVTAVAALGSIGCRTATQVTVELTTDVACSDEPNTSVQVGKPGAEVEDRPPFLATTACNGGRIGSFVVTPSGENDAEFALKVVLAHTGRSFDACRQAEAAGDFSYCIVARRVAKFVPHTEITLPIALRRDCEGVRCSPGLTCVRGLCVPATNMEPPLPPIDASREATADVVSVADATGDVPHEVFEAAPDAFDDPIDAGAGMDVAEAGVDSGTPIDSSMPIDSGTLVKVDGKVVNYWRQPVPGAIVYVGGSTATTDTSGAFSFANVTKPYDVGIAVRSGFAAFSNTDAWLYKGLTRADPTLEVHDGPHHTATNTRFSVTNLPPAPFNDAGLTANRWLTIGFGSPDTFFWTRGWNPRGFDIDYLADWWGVSSTAGHVHALLWETPLDDDFPTRFVAFDEHPFLLDEASASSTTFDLTPKAIPTGKVTGAVTSATSAKVQVDAYLRFDDGAFLPLASAPGSPRNFEFLVPDIAGTTITLSALIGSAGTPFGLAHVDGIAPNQTTVQLDVPTPLVQLAPEAGATGITPTTIFEWSASPNVARLVVSCPGPTRDDGHTRFYVVTQDYKSGLPSLDGPSEIPLPKNTQCMWWVEVHGTYRTVDAVAGSPAWLDSFSYDPTRLWGRNNGNGFYSSSGAAYATTAP